MTIPTGIYTATVKSRSVEVPSPAEAITYTVAVLIEGRSKDFDGVSPHASKRWSSYIPVGDNGEVPNLYPFKIGEPVILHVRRLGSTVQMFIGEGEVPAFGGC